jgi:hypothetical protein
MTTTPASFTDGAPELVHGRLTTYTHGKCRCPKCAARMNLWEADRRRQKAYGTWQPYVDAEPVRAHVLKVLNAGLTRPQIAAAASVNVEVVDHLLDGSGPGRGPARTMRPANAHALLGVHAPGVPPAGGHAIIDATRPQRELQALVAGGFPLRFLARQASLDLHTVVDIIYGRRQARAGTAHTIHALYGDLWDQQPADHGVRPHDIRRSHRIAARYRWAPALAWDDDTIANPDAVPDWTGRCGTTGGYYDHSQLNTPTCQPCRDAVSAAAAERKMRRRTRQAQQAA